MFFYCTSSFTQLLHHALILFITTLIPFTNVMINSISLHTRRRYQPLKDWNSRTELESRVLQCIMSMTISTQDLWLYWNLNQSCVQTGNWPRVDCVEAQKANHSTSNTYDCVCWCFFMCLCYMLLLSVYTSVLRVN